MEEALPIIWAGILVIAVVLYVILDGFDLGIGILFPFAPREATRDVMMNSVAPYWDGNETWLIMGGAGLLVAFPPAYAIIMPALYLPIIAMLLALIFRGVAFEFRWVAKPNHRWWDIAFMGGSTVAAFMQGVILGGILEGVQVSEGAFHGGAFDWLTPFSLLCGIAIVCGYGLLGATWLILKTEGPAQDLGRRFAPFLLGGVLLFMGAVSLWTPLKFDRIADIWFGPSLWYLWPVPLAAAGAAAMAMLSLVRGREQAPFLWSILLFLLGFLGLGISNFPYLVPPTLTVWQAAAAPESQMFMLVGAAVLIPLVLGYTVFVYRTFRGKVREGEGYH